ncbi:MAG: hypothetical protein AB2A00_33175 [Myxococcota bacterium]
MKRFLAAVGVVGALCGTAWAANKSDVLLVGKFAANGLAQDEAAAVESSVCTAATSDKRFVVKCRDTTQALMQHRQAQAELGFAEGSEFADNCGPQGCMGALAKGVEAKWVLSGSVAKVAEKQYLLTLMVADPVSGQQLNRVEEKVTGELSAVVDRVPGAVRKVLTPQQGAPAAQPAAPAPAPAKK